MQTNYYLIAKRYIIADGKTSLTFPLLIIAKLCNEIRQTMVTIHKLHLSINAVNSILNFNSDSIATEKERVHNNYYNYWI